MPLACATWAHAARPEGIPYRPAVGRADPAIDRTRAPAALGAEDFRFFHRLLPARAAVPPIQAHARDGRERACRHESRRLRLRLMSRSRSMVMPHPLTPPLLRFAATLRFPTLFWITAALFVFDLLVPDFIPFIDELLLGLLTLILASLRRPRAGVRLRP